MSISPTILFVGNKTLPPRGEFFQRVGVDTGSTSIYVGDDKCADMGDIYETPLDHFNLASLILASTQSAYNLGTDAANRTNALRKALPEIFQALDGEIAFKAIDNPLPQVASLQDAKDCCSASSYVLVKKDLLGDRENKLLERLKQAQEIEIIDHGNFYEISLGKTPFGNIKTAYNGNSNHTPWFTFGAYYDSLRMELAGAPV